MEIGTPLADVIERRPAAEPVVSPSPEEQHVEATKNDTGEASEQEGNGKVRGGWQRRIDKLTKRTKDLEQQLAQYEARTPTAQAPEAVQPQTPDEVERRARELVAQREHENNNRVLAQKVESFSRNASEMLSKNPDLIQRAKAAQFRPEVGLAISAALIDEGEKGPDVYLHLLRDEKLVKRVCKMSPNDAYREIIRLGARLDTPVRPQSSAPPPISPVSGSSARSTVDPEKMSTAEYIKRRNSGSLK